MPSFDVVSKVDFAEVDNALGQAVKEVTQRYDFKGSDTKIEREKSSINLESSDEYKIKATLDVLESKLVRRGISLKSMKPGPIEPSAKGRSKQKLDFQDGIDVDHAKELVKKLKDTKMKVQGSIQGDVVRVSGKKKDDLQEAIAFIRSLDFALPLQFLNFRD